jgi:hypothetical protein
MSNVTIVAAKKQSCGHLYDDVPRDVMGGQVNLQISGTDVNVSGVKTGASITVGTGNYSPGVDADGLPCTNPDGTFMICIETAGVFYVTLQDGSDFIITAVQSTAYLGQWYPGKIMSVNVGTTGDFSVGY